MNIVYRNRTDTGRIAEIGGKFYPYRWDGNRVTWGKWFAGHTEWGVKYVSPQCDTLEQAKRQLWR